MQVHVIRVQGTVHRVPVVQASLQISNRVIVVFVHIVGVGMGVYVEPMMVVMSHAPQRRQLVLVLSM